MFDYFVLKPCTWHTSLHDSSASVHVKGHQEAHFPSRSTHPSKVKECRVFLALTLRPTFHTWHSISNQWYSLDIHLIKYIYISNHYIIHDHGCKNSFTRSQPWTWTTSDPCDPTSLLDLSKHPRLQLCSEWRLTLMSWTSTGHLVTCWNWNRPLCFCLQYLKWEKWKVRTENKLMISFSVIDVVCLPLTSSGVRKFLTWVAVEVHEHTLPTFCIDCEEMI